MNEQQKITKMIEFVEEREQLLQQRKLLADPQAKNDTVKAILDKLEEITNED